MLNNKTIFRAKKNSKKGLWFPDHKDIIFLFTTLKINTITLIYRKISFKFILIMQSNILPKA